MTGSEALRLIPNRFATLLIAAIATLTSNSARGGEPEKSPGTPTLPVAAHFAIGKVRAMALDEALPFAMAHQPILREAIARVAAVGSDRGIVRAQWLPTVGGTVQILEGTTNNTTASYFGVRDVALPRIGGTRVTDSGAWGPDTSTLAAIGVNQEVFDFGRIAAQAAVVDAACQVERFRLDAEKLRVELLVKDAYYGVHGARSVLRAAEGAFVRATSHRDLAAAKTAAGLFAPIELTRAEADRSRFEAERIAAEGGLLSAQAVFAAAVGVPEPFLDVTGDPPPVASVPALAEGIRRSVDRNPIMLAGRSRVSGSELLSQAIAAESRPELIFSTTLSGRAGTASPSGGIPSDRYGPLPTIPNWDAGLILRLPLYDPVIKARAAAASMRADVARADLDVLARQQTAAVQEAYVSLQVSQAALTGLQRALEAALGNYAQADLRFKAGLGTAVELADAEAIRTETEIRVALGLFAASRARARLASLMAEGS